MYLHLVLWSSYSIVVHSTCVQVRGTVDNMIASSRRRSNALQINLVDYTSLLFPNSHTFRCKNAAEKKLMIRRQWQCDYGVTPLRLCMRAHTHVYEALVRGHVILYLVGTRYEVLCTSISPVRWQLISHGQRVVLESSRVQPCAHVHVLYICTYVLCTMYLCTMYIHMYTHMSLHDIPYVLCTSTRYSTVHVYGE